MANPLTFPVVVSCAEPTTDAPVLFPCVSTSSTICCSCTLSTATFILKCDDARLRRQVKAKSLVLVGERLQELFGLLGSVHLLRGAACLRLAESHDRAQLS